MPLFQLLLALTAAQAAFLPTVLIRTSSIANGAPRPGLFNFSLSLNATVSTFSGLIPIPNTSLLPPALLSTSQTISVVANLSQPISGLNPLSLSSTALQTSYTLPNAALNNIFNGLDVVFASSSAPIASILASVTSNANQVIPTADGLLQVGAASIPLDFVMPFSATTSLYSSTNKSLSTACTDVFGIASQALRSLNAAPITLKPAYSPFSAFVSSNPVSSSSKITTKRLSSNLSKTLSPGNAAFIPYNGTSAPSFASASPSSGLSPLPCTSDNSPSPSACSLIPGSVVPLNALLPCGNCPTNAGLSGVNICPWLCSISFFGAGVFFCSPIDITGQTFPDSGASNLTSHLAEAVCHQCAAPCNAVTSSPEAFGSESAAVLFSTKTASATTSSKELSCTDRQSSEDSPCCKQYGSRGNLVCTSCPLDPADLAVCLWLCRMPYAEGRIDLECSPVDLTGINLFSPYNETVHCKRCRSACSSINAATSTTTCVLSTTVSVLLTRVAPSVLTAVTTATAAAPTCTKVAPGVPSVTCIGGPDFPTLFCPQGCPTSFMDQCAFLCLSTLSSAFGGLFPALQCAPVDLSLISPGRISCQQCYPECIGNSTESSPGFSPSASNATKLPRRIQARTPSAASSPACMSVSPNAVDSPASQDSNTGLLFRSSCGVSAATVAQCPYLCSPGGGAFFQECSTTDISGEEPTGQFPPIICTHCLPPCGNSSVSGHTKTFTEIRPEVPKSRSTAATATSLANSSEPVLFTSLLPVLMSTASKSASQSMSALTLLGLSASASSVASLHVNISSPFSPNTSSSTKTAVPTATCISILLSGTDSPAIVEPNTGLLVRSSCGLTTETVAQCPFIGSAGGGAPNGNCYMDDMTGRLMYGSWPPLVCQQCLPLCEAAITASAASTCSSVAPNALDSSPFVDVSGLLYRGSCGTSATTVAECPYLCGLAGESSVPRQCFHQDLTNKKITGLFGDVGLLTCEKCLPPCGKSAIPTCTSDYSHEVTSLARAVPRSTALQQGGGLLPLITAERDSIDVSQRRDLVHAIVEGSSSTRLQLTCGDTAETVAACPFLCSPVSGGAQVYRHCATVDLTNNFIGVDRVACERCLPLCLNL